MHVREYITATYEILKTEPSQDVSHVCKMLKELLKKRGLLKFYPAILRGVLAKTEQMIRSEAPRITLAREADYSIFKKDIQEHLNKQIHSSPITHIDSNIIGGYIVQTKDVLVDQSYKTKLLHAYRRIIS